MFEVGTGIRQGSVVTSASYFVHKYVSCRDKRTFCGQKWMSCTCRWCSGCKYQWRITIDYATKEVAIEKKWYETKLFKYQIYGSEESRNRSTLLSMTIRYKVENLTYLRNNIHTDPIIEPQMNHRITRFSQTLATLYLLLNQKVKLPRYQVVLKPILMYISEMRPTTRKN